ncbi:hypothetical protein [Kitasatospora kazusensis]
MLRIEDFDAPHGRDGVQDQLLGAVGVQDGVGRQFGDDQEKMSSIRS